MSSHKMITDEQKTEPEQKTKKKRVLQLWNEDQIEVKKLSLDDVEDATVVMTKCSFDVTEKEVAEIVRFGLSFGCYVNRMLIGVGLAWPTNYNPNSNSISSGQPNALYFEDSAVLLAYEGRGIRRMLLHEREEESRQRSFKYTVAYLHEDLPRDNISSYIKEAGSQLEKLYLSENYTFFKTPQGILAVKVL